MLDKNFFDRSTEASRLKARIVTKYFYGWATALKKHVRTRENKLAYFDLFAGPGHYKEDGVMSTPLLVLESIIRHEDLREIVVPIFNDGSKTNVTALRSAIKDLPGIDSLRYYPKVTNNTVDQDFADYFMKTNMVPTLLFVDPWGVQRVVSGIDLVCSAKLGI